MTTAVAPWGTKRLALYPSITEVPYARTEIDPDTQTTRYLDADGRRVEMAGGHGTGTSTANSTATSSDGGGKNPPPPADSDLTEDSDSD
ncbi:MULTISPECIES: putative ATP-grasp-modified RiPP [unclassified Streptomyces]|uniref:putative ATP-grasp-modified RiPP n=1 Tax=unclassified Streptomyces TaxID=2593676 RepID=UPI002E292F3C|nr:putative ATP-grasp-modified RiPP [Streptomyces sp. NBC_01439]